MTTVPVTLGPRRSTADSYARASLGDNIFVIDQSRCIGCRACVEACGECGTHRGTSLIHLEEIDRAQTPPTVPMVCMTCEDPT